MTKPELIVALENILNNIVFGLVLTRIVPSDSWTNISPPIATFRGPSGDLLRLDFGPMCSRMKNPNYKKAVTEEFENCLKRATVREGHELLLLYCGETQQFSVYKSQAWFQFARIIRNVVSHKCGGILRNWPADLARNNVNSVSWQNRTLDHNIYNI